MKKRFYWLTIESKTKQSARSIETVKLQSSGNEHGIVKGIGLVNPAHTKGFEGDFYPVNYRLYDSEADGKTKNDHFREMFGQAISTQQIKARNIAFDAWYTSADNLKLIDRSGWTFYTFAEQQPQGKSIEGNWLSGFGRD